MFLDGKYQRTAVLATVGFLILTGCTASSQQSTVSRPVLPAMRAAAPGASQPTQRGLQGVVSGGITIVPGQSVGPLRLGDSRERSLILFGEPNEEYTFDENSLGPCRYTELHWNDLEHEDRWGNIYIFK
jgi:hypothetical protein